MTPATASGRAPILALNCGSSSLKYAVFAGGSGPDHVADHVIARATVNDVTDQRRAVCAVLDALAVRPAAVGHRLVHGGPDHAAPVRVDRGLVAELGRLIPLSPLHLPAELAAIEAVFDRLGDVPQVACFDTAFHATLPLVARRFALPAERLRRAVIAHLGSGASMVALRDGRSVETTMGFSPAGGLVMATRPGDLDPGLLVYLLDHGHDARSLERLVNHEAGLGALSETSSDMRRLLAIRGEDPRAALAVDAFCYHARKAIGALTAVLGGLDTLVFTGGIGQHAAEVRAEICGGLAHLGIALDDARNTAGAAITSTGRVEVRVMATDEEREIARATRGVLGGSI
jgi:acetate kinase